MSVAERRLLARVATRAAVIVLLLAALMLLMILRRILGAGTDGMSFAAVAAEFARMVGLAVTLAAPLAMLMVIGEVKGAGILAPLVAGGFGSGRLRRVFLWAAGGTMLLVALTEEAAWYPGERPDWVVNAWRDGEHVAWRSTGAPAEEGLVLLRDDTLDVWWVDDVTAAPDGFGLGAARSLLGTPLAIDRVAAPARPASALLPPPISVWLRGEAPLGSALASLNRVFVAGALVLLCAYFALLATSERQWVALVAFLFAVVVLGNWSVLLGVMLWQGGGAGYAGTLASWLLFAAALVWIHRVYDRRGIRLTA